MSEYQKLLQMRLRILKTDYITALTNIDRVEKDLAEAKTSTIEILGAIKNLELLAINFSNVVEVKPQMVIPATTESTHQKQTEKEVSVEEKIEDKRPTPRPTKNKNK